jgi:hypothetical protein
MLLFKNSEKEYEYVFDFTKVLENNKNIELNSKTIFELINEINDWEESHRNYCYIDKHLNIGSVFDNIDCDQNLNNNWNQSLVINKVLIEAKNDEKLWHKWSFLSFWFTIHWIIDEKNETKTYTKQLIQLRSVEKLIQEIDSRYDSI